MKKKYVYTYILTLITIISCRYNYLVIEKKDDSAAVDTTIVKHPQSEKFIQPYRDSMQKFMSVVIGESESTLTTAAPQGTLGNFVCDLVLEDIPQMSDYRFLQSEIHFVLFNTRGFRAPIPKGEITVSTIYQVMPFENEIVLVHMPASSSNQVLQTLVEKGGHPVSKNINLVADQKKGELLLVNNKRINDDYWIITTDYLATGGDDLHFFQSALEIIPTNIKLRDAILQHIKRLQQLDRKINAIIDERTLFFR